jgi:hypothetical protein
MRCRAVSVWSLLLIATVAQAQNKRDIAVREDKQTLAEDDSWFYDDLAPALDEAARTKRPLMIVFR